MKRGCNVDAISLSKEHEQPTNLMHNRQEHQGKFAIKGRDENENIKVRAQPKKCTIKACRDWEGWRGKTEKVFLPMKIHHRGH